MSHARTPLQSVFASAHDPRHERDWTPWGRRLAAEDEQRRRELASVGRQLMAYPVSTKERSRRKDAVARMCAANRKKRAGKGGR